RIPTPVITLIVGVALAASLLVSSMSAVSAKKAALAQAAASSAAAPTAATPAATPTAAGSSPAAGTSPSASPSSSSSARLVGPPHANYVGQVTGNQGSVAVVVHDTFAIAYFCNGSTQEAWLRGTPHNGKLSMTGVGNATLSMDYALGHARGQVTVHGISYP